MNINEIITAYNAAKAAEASAKKQAAELKALILQHAGDALTFTTDVYNVIIRETETTRIDTAALYKDFPDIKATYGKTSVSKTVNAVPIEGTRAKSA